jgi:uncharacterized protein (TIGR03905 family)
MAQLVVYKTKGTCSREIHVELEGNEIKSVEIIGGCDGNLKGIMSLLKGRDAEETIGLLEGITCNSKSTSCPDQIAHALRAALGSNS